MPDLAHWAAFVGATLTLLVTPGPSIMFVTARGVALGWRTAVLSSVGLALGDLLQVIATAAGLSALLATAPIVITSIRLAGAAYLIVLGTITLAGRGARAGTESQLSSAPKQSTRTIVLQGFMALNPKTALFFLAFLPQFIQPTHGSVTFQILTFGIVFVLLGFLTNSGFGCLSAQLPRIFKDASLFQRRARVAGGLILICLGVLAVGSVHRSN